MISFYIRKHTIKTVELVRAKEDKLLFVEAKTTFPNPDNPSIDNFENFQKQINDICDKNVNFGCFKITSAKIEDYE